MKEAFDCIDEDCDGLISLDDLNNFMQLIGMGSTSQSEIAEMITDHDTDGKTIKKFRSRVVSARIDASIPDLWN